ARARLAAIAAPIVPRPTNATRSTTTSCCVRRAYRQRPSRRVPSRTMEWLGVDRRRLGTGMLVFGLAGMVIAGIVAVALVMGAFAARNLDDRLAADQVRIAQSLDRLSTTMASLAATTDNAGATLGTTSEALQDAEAILESAEAALQALADALDIS